MLLFVFVKKKIQAFLDFFLAISWHCLALSNILLSVFHCYCLKDQGINGLIMRQIKNASIATLYWIVTALTVSGATKKIITASCKQVDNIAVGTLITPAP